MSLGSSHRLWWRNTPSAAFSTWDKNAWNQLGGRRRTSPSRESRRNCPRSRIKSQSPSLQKAIPARKIRLPNNPERNPRPATNDRRRQPILLLRAAFTSRPLLQKSARKRRSFTLWRAWEIGLVITGKWGIWGGDSALFGGGGEESFWGYLV